MKIKQTILGSVALGTAALMLSPADSQGFSLLGHSLGQTQRDFRIFDDFVDTQANNNTSLEPNFPGYTGAVLALWKGAVEWGSGPHGDGSSTDTSQSNLGDGGANFDPSFQGEATSVGGGSSNIMSPLSGGSGGVFAFMTGGGGGWRIRFYEAWTWADGPGGIGGGQADLQAIGCHEYGHALGLGHSGGAATMAPGTSTGSLNWRSINNDDAAGVQAIYGVKSASKPEITGLTVNGSSVTVDGFNFAASGNEVWFTQAAAGGTGTPVKVTGVSSSGGGTEITVGVPLGAGDGDVLVRSTSGNAGLSNAWPIDTDGTIMPEPLAVDSVSPTQIPALTANNDQTFMLMGSGFTGATEVTIGGSSLSTFPKTWTVINDNVINFELAPLDQYGITALGTYTIEVFDPSGSDTVSVEIVAPADPVLRIGTGADDQFFISGFPSSFYMGGNPDNVHFLWASLNLGATPYPGLFDLDIGNSDYPSVVLALFDQLESNGNFSATLTLPSSVAGATVYWQSVEYDLGTGALPIPASNVGQTFVLF